MTYDEARRRRIELERQHMREAKEHGDTPHLRDLNKELTAAIFEEAHASRDTQRTSEG